MKCKIRSLICFSTLISASFSDASAATNFQLTRGQVQSISLDGKKYLCGSPASKWVPVKKVKGNTFTQLKTANAAYKTACGSVIPRGAIKNLSQLPDIKDLTKAAPATGGIKLKAISDLAVSGIAPVIPSVPSLDATQLFWRTGVISAINSGSPSADQCSEFWGSSEDGKSSGQTACYMLQNVGQSIGNIIQAGNSLCYMKEVPTARMTNSRSARLISGSVPGGIARIFDTPTGSSARTIKTEMAGGDEGEGSATQMYIRVASRSELDAGANLYKYELWDCVDGRVVSRESGTVRLNGDFIASSSGDSGEGTYNNIVRGYVTTSGRDIAFDTSRERSVTQQFNSPQGRLSNSQILVTPENEIISKQRARSSEETEKSYSISSFSGTSVADLRFLSGATKMNFLRSGQEQNFTGSSEYRDTFYASAPFSSYATAVGEFNFADDSFYSGDLESPSLDSRGISCSPRVDVTVSIDMTSPVMNDIRQECEGTRLDGFDMCQGEALQEAYQNFNSVCPL